MRDDPSTLTSPNRPDQDCARGFLHEAGLQATGRIWRKAAQGGGPGRGPDDLRPRRRQHNLAGGGGRHAARPVHAGPTAGGHGDISRLRGKRILLVEDEAILAIDAAMILDDMGLDVIGPCATLQQGLATAEAELLDLAMLDVNLRGEMSYPIADVLLRRGVPLIFATGYDSLDWRGTAPRIGKPYSQRDIEMALLSVIT